MVVLHSSPLALLYRCCCSITTTLIYLCACSTVPLLLLYYTYCLAVSVACLCLCACSTTSVLLLYYTSALLSIPPTCLLYAPQPCIAISSIYFFSVFLFIFSKSFLVYVSSAGYFMGDGLAVLFRCVDASNAVAATPPPIPHAVADSGGAAPAAPSAPAPPLPAYSSCSSSATLILLLLLLLSLSLSFSLALSIYIEREIAC